ncbi:group 1 glycosyl transferase [Caballeronia novacaledonica]|uniref:Group 1 glycosyl transferase n=1 Tax=Caballeronia novacaledonica TaxID=1544861 RepID=A0A2U3IFN2_9BURK|nr:glycosyltransferase family 4 protein [Caballeronia novacaledonica]SPB18945.1 group 1 glycosyl transferase [Caballeronia novacaledonica]
MKVLIANTLYFPDEVGGAEVATRLLAEGLVKAGVEVCVVCATGVGEDRSEEINGAKVYRLRSSNLYWPHAPGEHSRVAKLIWHAIDVRNTAMSRKLADIIRREKPDVVNTANLSCLSVDAWRVASNAGVPIVHTIHDYYLLCPTATMLTGGKPCPSQCGVCSLYAKPKQIASAQVNAAVGVSGFVLQKHVESGFFSRAAKTTVINNCFTPTRDSTGEQHSRPTGNAPLRLGMLGRVLPEKGIELLLEQLLADRTLDWTLAVGGSGDPDYVEDIKAKYADPRVNFLGRVDPPDFLSKIDILVVPSVWNEPFGLVVLEAYSHGVPVVGSSLGGIPEIIEPRSNLLFDVASPETLIGKIHEASAMLDDPSVHDRLRQHAKKFSLDAMINAYVELYEEMVCVEERKPSLATGREAN